MYFLAERQEIKDRQSSLSYSIVCVCGGGGVGGGGGYRLISESERGLMI